MLPTSGREGCYQACPHGSTYPCPPGSGPADPLGMWCPFSDPWHLDKREIYTVERHKNSLSRIRPSVTSDEQASLLTLKTSRSEFRSEEGGKENKHGTGSPLMSQWAGPRQVAARKESVHSASDPWLRLCFCVAKCCGSVLFALGPGGGCPTSCHTPSAPSHLFLPESGTGTTPWARAWPGLSSHVGPFTLRPCSCHRLGEVPRQPPEQSPVRHHRAPRPPPTLLLPWQHHLLLRSTSDLSQSPNPGCPLPPGPTWGRLPLPSLDWPPSLGSVCIVEGSTPGRRTQA